jgi:hypothetical protein
MKRHLSPVIVTTLALSLLTACGSGTDNSGNTDNNAKISTSNEKSAPDAEANANNGSNEMGVDQPDPSKAIYSKQFSLPGETGKKVTVGILSLKRQDKVLMLKVVVTPEFADKSAGETIEFVKAIDGLLYWDPTLLDLKNLKKYKVLSGSGGMLNFDDGVAVSGQPIYGWAAFAPPPAGVTSIDLTMVAWMPRFTNVPIS